MAGGGRREVSTHNLASGSQQSNGTGRGVHHTVSSARRAQGPRTFFFSASPPSVRRHGRLPLHSCRQTSPMGALKPSEGQATGCHTVARGMAARFGGALRSSAIAAVWIGGGGGGDSCTSGCGSSKACCGPAELA